MTDANVKWHVNSFCYMMSCRLEDRYRHIEETFCLHLQGIRVEIKSLVHSESLVTTYQSMRHHIIGDTKLHGTHFPYEPDTSFFKCISSAKSIGNKRLCFLISLSISVTMLSLIEVKSNTKCISKNWLVYWFQILRQTERDLNIRSACGISVFSGQWLDEYKAQKIFRVCPQTGKGTILGPSTRRTKDRL
jgi:hypothetical protein